MINGKVYKEIDYEEVLSNHNANGTIYYHIFYGDVDWQKNGNSKKAICLFMKYNGKVNVVTPANVLLEDLKSVEDGIKRIKSRNNIE